MTRVGTRRLLQTESSLVSIPVPQGPVEVVVEDPRVSGAWRFDCPAPSAMSFDFLAAEPVDVPGSTAVARARCEGFVAAPRVRLSINQVPYELVSSAAAVLQQHYTRPDHQSIYNAERWGAAYHAARVRQCRRLLRGITGEVCDIGSGHSMVRQSRTWPDPVDQPFTLHACDVDPEVVAALQAAGVDARLAPADDPPFENDRFDAVYTGEVVEHLTRPHEALRRWVQLLKPGGRLIVTTPNRRHLLTRVRGFEVVENPEHLFEWDLTQLRDAVRAAGAHVDHVEGLVLPIPVIKPGHGWRDLTPALVYRFGGRAQRLGRGLIGAGRWVPNLAYNLAVSAHRTH